MNGKMKMGMRWRRVDDDEEEEDDEEEDEMMRMVIMITVGMVMATTV